MATRWFRRPETLELKPVEPDPPIFAELLAELLAEELAESGVPAEMLGFKPDATQGQ